MQGFKHFFEPYPIDTPALSVHGIGIQEQMPPTVVERRQGRTDYLFMYFYQETLIGTQQGEARCPAGSFIIWTPHQPQKYGVPERPWAHSWLHGAGSLLKRWLRETQLPCNEVLALNEPSLIEHWLEELHQELAGPFKPDPRIARNLIENGLRTLARARRRARLPQPPHRLMQVRLHLDSHFHQPVRLPQLARMANLSVAHFCALFKEHFHTPAIEYVIRLRMQRAAYLLRERGLRVRDAAEQVGYDDVYHFAKLFKKRYGVSPGKLRG